MEIKYLDFLEFLRNNDNKNIAMIYKDIASACRNLKRNQDLSIGYLKTSLERINAEVCKIENISIDNIYDFYKQNDLYINEINDEVSYQNGIHMLELIYAVSLKYFSVENYLDYFSSLDCDDSFEYERLSRNGPLRHEEIKIRTVYKKIGEFINNLKTYPNVAIQDIRNALIDFCRFILKRSNVENVESIMELQRLNFIFKDDAACLSRLIKIRNNISYNEKDIKKNDIDLMVEVLEVMYRMTKKLYPNTKTKNASFNYNYFPIDGAKVLFYSENKNMTSGQHLGTYYVIKEGDYGLKYSHIIRLYEKHKIDENLIKHDNNGYMLAMQGLNNKNLSSKYYLTKRDIPTKNNVYEFVTYDIPEDYTQVKYPIIFTEKQIEQIIYDVAVGLRNLTMVEPVIHHRNINYDTVFYQVDSDNNAHAKIGYFEHSKIKKANVVTVYINAITNRNYFMPEEVVDNSSIDLQNYDWELYDVYSVGKLFVYLLFGKEENINSENVREKISNFKLSTKVKELISNMIDEAIYNRPHFKQVVEILEEDLK